MNVYSYLQDLKRKGYSYASLFREDGFKIIPFNKRKGQIDWDNFQALIKAHGAGGYKIEVKNAVNRTGEALSYTYDPKEDVLETRAETLNDRTSGGISEDHLKTIRELEESKIELAVLKQKYSSLEKKFAELLKDLEELEEELEQDPETLQDPDKPIWQEILESAAPDILKRVPDILDNLAGRRGSEQQPPTPPPAQPHEQPASNNGHNAAFDPDTYA